VHHRLLGALKTMQHVPGGMGLLSAMVRPAAVSDRLSQELLGVTFQNPVGLAAGFDKHVELIPSMRALGFGFEEVGSLSALSWPGNETPRVFRLPRDKAIINRMGLNNPGVQGVIETLKHATADRFPLGVSLVKTPDANVMGEAGIMDYSAALEATHGLGAYVSLNISCPNTEEGKTFEDPESLDTLLLKLRRRAQSCQARTGQAAKPWLLKVSPDLSESQLDELFDVALRHDIAGWIATNTSARRENLVTPEARLTKIGRGGLSGRPIREASTRTLATLYQRAQKDAPKMVLMGVGGVFDVDSAWEKITHGASLIQVYTGLIYEGPGLVRQLVKGLDRKLAAEGFGHIGDAVGAALR
jgi:dihydroorotate dehydrogenase